MDFARFLVRRGAVGLKADFAHSKSGFRLFGERIVLNIIKLYPQKDFAIFEGRISMLIVKCVPQKSYSNAPAAPSPMDSVAPQLYIHGYLRSLTLSGIDIF